MSKLDASLQVPAARQGPGPMPAGLVDALELAVNRLVTRTMPGSRLGAGVGPGLELAQLRPYETGDDVRHVDAAASARTGALHVRLHVPDRALSTWIVLDLSPSMAFGTSRRLKADVAEGAALVFGRLGVRRAGSVGLVAFGAGPARVLPPRGSKPATVALRSLLAEGLAPDGRGGPEELADALKRTGRLASQSGLVVLISDFRDQRRWETPLGALRMRHATLAIEVADPREAELPPVGRVALIDPETGSVLQVNTTRRVRERFAALERERRQRVADELRRLRVSHVTLSTDQDWLAELGRRIR